VYVFLTKRCRARAGLRDVVAPPFRKSGVVFLNQLSTSEGLFVNLGATDRQHTEGAAGVAGNWSRKPEDTPNKRSGFDPSTFRHFYSDPPGKH